MRTSRLPSDDSPDDDFDEEPDQDFEADADVDSGAPSDDDDALPEIDCPKCGASIVEDTQKCPHCGEWIEDDHLPLHTRPRSLLYVLLVFVLIALILSWAI